VREIGYNKPVFIIAEAGINHNGDLKLAKEMAWEAYRAGADSVKYQTFIPSELGDRYKNITYAETKELKEYCDEIGILFLSTPHSESAVDFLNDLVPAFKVASPFLFNKKFLVKVLGKSKPIIISIHEKAVSSDFEWLTEIKKPKVYFMHTVCHYPAISPLFLRLYEFMKLYPDTLWGYSDHTIGIENCVGAVKVFGACIIEKHFKIVEDCPDSDHSATPLKLRRMVDEIREMEKAKNRTPEAHQMGLDGIISRESQAG